MLRKNSVIITRPPETRRNLNLLILGHKLGHNVKERERIGEKERTFTASPNDMHMEGAFCDALQRLTVKAMVQTSYS